MSADGFRCEDLVWDKFLNAVAEKTGPNSATTSALILVVLIAQAFKVNGLTEDEFLSLASDERWLDFHPDQFVFSEATMKEKWLPILIQAARAASKVCPEAYWYRLEREGKETFSTPARQLVIVYLGEYENLTNACDPLRN